MYIIILVGILAGVIYFNIMERDIPRNSNCSYIANIWTDLLAFVTGFIIIYYGFKYSNNVLVLLGTAIITEHIMQFFGHKYKALYDILHN